MPGFEGFQHLIGEALNPTEQQSASSHYSHTFTKSPVQNTSALRTVNFSDDEEDSPEPKQRQHSNTTPASGLASAWIPGVKSLVQSASSALFRESRNPTMPPTPIVPGEDYLPKKNGYHSPFLTGAVGGSRASLGTREAELRNNGKGKTKAQDPIPAFQKHAPKSGLASLKITKAKNPEEMDGNDYSMQAMKQGANNDPATFSLPPSGSSSNRRPAGAGELIINLNSQRKPHECANASETQADRPPAPTKGKAKRGGRNKKGKAPQKVNAKDRPPEIISIDDDSDGSDIEDPDEASEPPVASTSRLPPVESSDQINSLSEIPKGNTMAKLSQYRDVMPSDGQRVKRAPMKPKQSTSLPPRAVPRPGPAHIVPPLTSSSSVGNRNPVYGIPLKWIQFGVNKARSDFEDLVCHTGTLILRARDGTSFRFKMSDILFWRIPSAAVGRRPPYLGFSAPKSVSLKKLEDGGFHGSDNPDTLDSHIHMEFKMEVQEGTAAAIDRLVSTLPTAKSEGIDTDFLDSNGWRSHMSVIHSYSKEAELEPSQAKRSTRSDVINQNSTAREELKVGNTSSRKPSAKAKQSMDGTNHSLDQFYGPTDGSESTSAQNNATRASTSGVITRKRKAEQETPQQPIEPGDSIVLVYPFEGTGGLTITRGDLQRLEKDDDYLNDTLIEFGLRRIMDEINAKDAELAKRVHMFNSFFFKKLTQKSKGRKEVIDYASVAKWTKKFDLFEKRYIVVPINENFHWYLAIIVNPAVVLSFPEGTPPKKPKVANQKTRHSERIAAIIEDNEDTLGSTAEPAAVVDDSADELLEPLTRKNLDQSASGQSSIPATAPGSGSSSPLEPPTPYQAPSRGPLSMFRDDSPAGDVSVLRSSARIDSISNRMDLDSETENSESEGPGHGVGEEISEPDEVNLESDLQRGLRPAQNTFMSNLSNFPFATGGSVNDVDMIGGTTANQNEAIEAVKLQQDGSGAAVNVSITGSGDLTTPDGAPSQTTSVEKGYILIFDSLDGSPAKPVKALRRYLAQEATAKKNKDIQEATAEAEKDRLVGASVHVPNQTNFSDCGLYLLHFVKSFLLNSQIAISNAELKLKKGEKKPRIEEWKTPELTGKRKALLADIKELSKEWKIIKAKRDAEEAKEKAARKLAKEEAKRKADLEADGIAFSAPPLQPASAIEAAKLPTPPLEQSVAGTNSANKRRKVASSEIKQSILQAQAFMVPDDEEQSVRISTTRRSPSISPLPLPFSKMPTNLPAQSSVTHAIMTLQGQVSHYFAANLPPGSLVEHSSSPSAAEEENEPVQARDRPVAKKKRTIPQDPINVDGDDDDKATDSSGSGKPLTHSTVADESPPLLSKKIIEDADSSDVSLLNDSERKETVVATSSGATHVRWPNTPSRKSTIAAEIDPLQPL